MLTEDDWNQAQQKITIAWGRGKIEAAYDEIARVRASGTAQMKAQSLLYRGMIKEDVGDYCGAREDLRQAASENPSGSFARYTAEHMLGVACEKSGLSEEALRQYREALQTCLAGDDFSGGHALERFLALAGVELRSEDHHLATAVIEKSWKVLELQGEPDLDNPVVCAKALVEKTKRAPSSG